MRTRILCFISNANFSGATKLTFDILELFDKKSFDIRVVFLKYNPAANHLFILLKNWDIPYTVLNKTLPLWTHVLPVSFLIERVINKIFGSFIRKLKLIRVVREFNPDIIYSNTVLLPINDLELYIDNAKIFCHIHLVPSILTDFHKVNNDSIALLNRCHTVIANASITRENLINRGVHNDRIYLLPVSIIPNDDIHVTRDELRKELGCNRNTILIAASGVASHRKGTDTFIEMAYKISMQRSSQDIKFLWLGGGFESFLLEQYDKIKSMFKIIEDRFSLPGEVNNPNDYYNACDVFVVCARSESGPLTLLENMYMRKPVVSFKDCGIAQDALVDCGTLVENDNVEELSKQVLLLAQDSTRRNTFGELARSRVKESFNLVDQVKEVERLFVNSLEK